MPVAVQERIRCEHSGTDSTNVVADRGIDLAEGGIPAVMAPKNLTARFSISDNGSTSRCFAVKSHGGNLRCKASRRKPEMQDIAGACVDPAWSPEPWRSRRGQLNG